MVVAGGDEAALRLALQDVLENREAWSERGRAALEYAKAGFDVKVQAAKLAGLLREVGP
jgi:glycosyltransferase involved in cell wall biosynthesis